MIKHIYFFLLILIVLLKNGMHSQAQTHENVYLIKAKNYSSKQIIENVLGIELLQMDERLESKGFLLVQINDNFNLIELNKSPEIEYVSPVYFNNNKEFISYSNEIFVAFKDHTTSQQIDFIIEKYHLVPKNDFKSLPNVYKYCIPQKAHAEIQDFTKEIAQETYVRYCQPNYLFSPLTATNDQFFPRQWALQNNGTPLQFNGTPGADMKVVEAWSISTGNPNIRVAVLDSGVDTLHPDLTGNLLRGYDAINDSTHGHPTYSYSSDAHGTACAGIIGAIADNGIGIAGIAHSCKILPVQIFYYVNFMGQIIPWASTETMVRGITWAWQEGQADVMSNSWGVPDNFLSFFPGQDSIVNEAIYLALSHGRNGKGVPLLFSSGNDGGLPIWPSRLPEVIAVNASSMCDERKFPGSCDNENWEGNWGEGLSIAAPGVKIMTTDISGSFGYSTGNYTATFNGTSAACPNAAGVMALILSVNPNLTVQEATYVLEASADKVGGYDYIEARSSGLWSPEMGYGRVNALNALLLAQTIVEEDIKENIYVYADNHTGKHVVVCSLSEDANVSVEIINLLGRQIAQFPQQKLDKGTHHFVLNNFLKQGIYIARIYINDKISTIKFFAYS